MTEQHSQTDNPVASTPVPVIKTEEASPSRQTGGNGNTLLTVLVVLAVLLGGYSFYRTIFPSHAAGGIAAYLQEALANIQSDSPEQAQQKLAAQLAGIQTKLDELAADGRIVVRKSAVLTYPPEADMTEQVAAELGIKLSPIPASATTPAPAPTLPSPAITPVGHDALPAAASEGRLGSQLD